MQEILKIMFEFVKQRKALFGVYFIIMSAYSMETLLSPHLYGKIIKELQDKNIPSAFRFFTMLMITWVLMQACFVSIHYLDSFIVPRFQAYLREVFYDKIIKGYSENYKELDLGNIITKITKLPDKAYDLYMCVKYFIFGNIFALGASFGYLYYVTPKLFYTCVVCVIVLGYLCYMYSNDCAKKSFDMEHETDILHEDIQDSLNNTLAIYLNRKKTHEINRFGKINKTISGYVEKMMECNTKYRGIFGVAFLVSFVVLNYVAFTEYTSGKIGIDSLVATFMVIISTSRLFLDFFFDFKEVIFTSGTLYEFDNYIKEITNSIPSIKTKRLNDQHFTIEFKNVSLKLDNTQNKILDDVNIRIMPKEQIAIRGHVGSGKSTMTRLLLKLIKPTSGEITINDIPISDLNTSFIRSIIVYIPQSPKLFNRTLFENITYRTPNVTKKDIYELLHKVGMDDLAEVFKGKMESRVGPNGSRLSGGQCQIVWLLRAFFSKTPIIILDEPTASIDPDNRKKIIKIVHELFNDRMLIILSHDEELIGSMKRVIRMGAGKVISDSK